jgi:peroxiredoxin
LRDRNDEVSALGATIVAVGTGDQRYAEGFVRDERIPFTVLVDDDAAAATAASVETLSWAKLMHPKTWKATRETSKRGYHIHKAGKRVRQIGATFVVGPGDKVRYAHLDTDSTDHASVDEVLAALR